MARQTLNCLITGEAPLVLHNGQTADPLNKFAKAMKAVSSKRKKTDSDHEEMSRIEWFASLYLDNGRVCLPAEVLEAAIINGAKKLKLGTQAKATVFCPENAIVEFDGDNLTPEQLWERDQNRLTVRVGLNGSSVMRTRFIAREWKAQVAVSYDDSMLNQGEVRDILNATGTQCGIGDWRPRHGRFTVEITD